MRHTTAPDIAPDGSALAFILRDDADPEGLPVAMQAPLLNGVLGDARRIRIPASGPAVAVRYSPHAHWLAVEIAPEGTERTEIWLVSTDPGDDSAVLLRDDTDAKTSLVEWDAGHLAVDAVREDGLAEGRLVSPVDGSVQVIDRRVDGKLVAAHAGHALMRVGPRANRELLLIGPDGSWRPLLPPQPGATTDAGCILPPREDGEPVMLVCSDHHSDRRRVLRIHAKHGVMRSRELIHYREADVDEFCISGSEEAGAVLWNLSGRSALEVLRLDPDQRVTARREVTLPGMVAHGLRITDDGASLVCTVESPDAPPTVYLVDTRTSRMTPVTGVPVDGDVRLLGEPELLRYSAHDGVELSGWLYRAVGSDGAPVTGPAPMLLHFHGGPEGQSRPGHHDVLRAVIDAGVSVFTPNVRGSSGDGRAFQHADNRYGRFAGIRDLEDSASFLVDAGLADRSRLAVSGRSYGGYLVNVAVTWFPDLFRAAVCACGMSDLETFYRDTEPWIASAAFPKYGYPIQDGELLKAVSPLVRLSGMPVSGAGAATTPVLFIHGLHDTNVPPSEYLQMSAALAQRGVPTAALELEDEGHVFVRPVNRQRIAAAMVDWLTAHGVC
ncbi:prolyl oligopeptidase family serine peptidase [Corynebacterium sp.]|uniref:alpha/beta hydrolase family protein n=1 Tax=Corynebacterium sp. TaxID=1720 RepID=UPI0025B8142A|nr:prolyl oligopeptidase family serine peptidase [Corynebacterium sp.]